MLAKLKMVLFANSNLHFRSWWAACEDVTLWNQLLPHQHSSMQFIAQNKHIQGIWTCIYWMLCLWGAGSCWCSLLCLCARRNRGQLFCPGLYGNKVHVTAKFQIHRNYCLQETLSIPSPWKPKDYIWKYFIFRRVCLPQEYVYLELWKGSYLLVFPSNGVSI